MLLRVLGLLCFCLGCLCLYYAFGALFLVPGDPGERYFSTWRIVPGTISSLCALIAFGVTGLCLRRLGSKKSFFRLIVLCIACAVFLVIAFWIGLMLFVRVGWL